MPQRLGPNGASSSVDNDTLYTVVRGDSLSKIATRFGVTLEALVAANRGRYPELVSSPGAIEIDWELKIPPGAPRRPAAPRSNDDILIVAMNAAGAHEAEQLRARGNKVTLVLSAEEQGTITTREPGGARITHDLSTEAGAQRFAETLELDAEQTRAVAKVIYDAGLGQSASPKARDELAQIAQVWAKAERGGSIPSRLVLSGHNVGSGVWGDDNGKLYFTTLAALATAMPKAAEQVEDLHLAACYSGGETKMDTYRRIFPRLKTIWAYSGSAPGSHSGATAHQSRWDKATRGEISILDRDVAAGTRKGESVAVWTVVEGYEDGRGPTPLASLRSAYDNTARSAAFYFSGDLAVENPQVGPLRDHYNRIQALLQHRDLPDDERAPLEAERDRTIRLLFYATNVAPRFQEAHADELAAAHRALGLEVPDFAQLTRAEANARIQAFVSASVDAMPQTTEIVRGRELLEGLLALSPEIIPETWI